MDNAVTLKFFRVERSYAHCIDFEQALREALGVGSTPASREQNINAGGPKLIVRLERLTGNGKPYVAGEMIRKQVANIPPEANEAGLTRLQLNQGSGLGLSSAFLFHVPTQVLLLQSTAQSVSQGRLGLYLHFVNKLAEYTFSPVATANAWARFNSGEPRKIRMRLAAPQNFSPLKIDGKSVGRGMADIGESLHAPYLTIEVSMGRKRGSLASAPARKWVDSLLKFGQSHPGSVETLSASVTDGDGPDVIDFLQEQLVVKDELDLDDTDPTKNYAARKAFLESTFNEHLGYITKLYAAT